LTIWRALTVLSGLVWATTAGAADALTPHSAEYRVKISVLSGELLTRLSATDDGYQATYLVKPKGLASVIANGTIEATSDFVDAGSGFLPVHHVTADSISKDKIQADLAFDWDTKTVAGTLNGQPLEQSLDAIVHDFVTLQYEIGRDLRNDAIKDNYILFEPDELKHLQVQIVGTETVEVPHGTYEVVGVRHQREGSSRTTTFWFAPELDYLPVIIERHRKGKTLMRAVLREYVETAP
jgi:hypothetical protein